MAEVEAKYADIEKQLAAGPAVTVPTITLEGDANGAPHVEPAAYAKRFSGKYSHRTIKGGIGHNLPQEAPRPGGQRWRRLDHGSLALASEEGTQRMTWSARRPRF